MEIRLVVLRPGKQRGRVLEVRADRFFVGRDPRCHLRPASPLIGVRHCAILRRAGKAFVCPLGGAGRTFVNDQPVTDEVELHHDDRLRIGPLLFAVRLDAGTPANEPTPLPPTRAPAPVRTRSAPRMSAAEAAQEEESVAALLLQDDHPPAAAGPLSGPGEPAETPGGQAPPPAPGKESKPKPAAGDTAGAAKAILDRYRTRPRS